MKIKYTQRVRDVDADTDFALAMALEEDEAEICNSDDDFQTTGPAPVIFNQTLALLNCVKKKQVKKKVSRKNLSLEKKQRGGGNEIGDAAQLGSRAGRGKELMVHCEDITKFMLESTATFVEIENLVSNEGERKRKEPEVTDKRALRDDNSRSSDGAKLISSVTDPSVLAERDKDGIVARSGKVEKNLIHSNSKLWGNCSKENTDRGTDGPIPCEQPEQQRQTDSILKLDSKREKNCSSLGAGCNTYVDSAKKVKTTARVSDDDDTLRHKQIEGIARLGSSNSEGDEVAESDCGAAVDEDMVICTQVDAPVRMKFGPSVLERCGIAVDVREKTTEGRPKRKNIYDILLGKCRMYRLPDSMNEEGPTTDGEVEDMDTPGTAMRALVDEAELDYEGLGFNEDDNESMDSFECPVCGIALVDLFVSDREQHVSSCLDKDNISCGRTNAGDCLDREAERDEATGSVQPLISEQNVIIESLECPVCGVCIQELSNAERETHTNSCLEKDNISCDREYAESYPGGGAETPEAAEIGQLLSSQSNVMNLNLECPVCQICIGGLSTAQREEHTNACLDKCKEEELGEVSEFAEAAMGQAAGRPDMAPVVTWLTNLNLAKYVDIFVKEEIDWDTLKWLTEEDLNSLGISALGPRRKILSAINELRNVPSTSQHMTAIKEGQKLSDSALPVTPVDTSQGSRKSIADFFIPPPITERRVPAPDNHTLAGPKASGNASTTEMPWRNTNPRRAISAVRNSRAIGTSGIPTWMCIPGTSFRVDAFKHTTGNCSNWFLTHFHTDHYQGLTRGFRHGKIFCSSITARLISLRIGVPLDRIQALPLNETVLIDGVRVTFIDANHCPGSVMILFEPPNGEVVLHTGDFRYYSDMASNDVLRKCRITTLILDTTYCDPQHDFPKQDSVIQFVIDAIQAEAFNPKTLFLIGTYTIGKEKLFLEVGKALQKYVYVGSAKQRLLDCMDLTEEDKRWLTTKDQESHIHVVPLWSVASFKRMGSISRHYHGRYDSIVAFSPTGCSFGKDKKRVQGRPGRRYQQGSIIRYEVPYSEHSSFTELKEFVRFIGSENIIPSVISSTGPTADAMVVTLLNEES